MERKSLRQTKKIRALEIKVRDLSVSRENWKQRALAAELQLKKQEDGETSEKKKKSKSRKQT